MVQEGEREVYVVDRQSRLVHLAEQRQGCEGPGGDSVVWPGHDLNVLRAQGFTPCGVCFGEVRPEAVVEEPEESEEEGEEGARE